MREFERVLAALRPLTENPRHEARKMQGTGQEEWRLRVGDYRVVYRIEEPHPESGDGELQGLVTVLAVGAGRVYVRVKGFAGATHGVGGR